MIKIFSSDKIIYLINDRSIFRLSEDAVLADIQSKNEMLSQYNKWIKKKNVNKIYFFNEDIKHLFGYFSSMFSVIEAAGGLVKNKKNEWLFIFRKGKWDLPKGKIEKGEGIKTAAIREVKEECGVSKLKIIKELSPTYHTYFIKEKTILKPTYWFEMQCDDTSKLVPQTEEGITEVKWIAKKNLKLVLENTYGSIKEVIKNI